MAGTEDIAKLNSVTAPDFYIFANGMRFNADALMAAIKTLHAAGKRNEEQVTEPDIHITGNTAWIAYVKRQHHRRFRHRQAELVGIGLLGETGRRVEGPLHAQHPRPYGRPSRLLTQHGTSFLDGLRPVEVS
jgi:hypothetical protein